MLMKADDAEEDPQATTNNTSISLKNRERLLHTVRQEIPDKRFLGRHWLWRNPSTTQAQGWTSTTWILKTHLKKSCQDTQQIPSLLWVYMEERWMLKINFAGLWWGGSREEKLLPKLWGHGDCMGGWRTDWQQLCHSGCVLRRHQRDFPIRHPGLEGFICLSPAVDVFTPLLGCWDICRVGPESWAIKPFFHHWLLQLKLPQKHPWDSPGSRPVCRQKNLPLITEILRNTFIMTRFFSSSSTWIKKPPNCCLWCRFFSLQGYFLRAHIEYPSFCLSRGSWWIISLSRIIIWFEEIINNNINNRFEGIPYFCTRICFAHLTKRSKRWDLHPLPELN